MWPFDIFKKKNEQKGSHQVNSQLRQKTTPHVSVKEAYLIVFSAKWCGPSKRFLKEISTAGLNYSLIDVDKDEFSDMTTKYQVRSIPMTILMDTNENIIYKWDGYDDEDPGQSKLIKYVKTSGYTLIHYPGSEAPATPVQSKVYPPKPEPIAVPKQARNSNTLPYRLEDIKSIRLGENMSLMPYDAGWVFESQDVQLLTLLANTPAIQRYLPGLDFSSEDATRKTLMGLALRAEAYAGFSYAIRMGHGIMGMITLDSPLYNKGTLHKDIWTIDFFALPMAEHKGIMFQSIIRILNMMKTVLHVDKVYAIVDPSNRACLNLINNGLFTQVYDMTFRNTQGGDDPIPFVIDLRTIDFRQR